MKSLELQIQTFTSLVQQGIDAWSEAGRILVEILDSDVNAKQNLLDSCPDVTPEILSHFEAIGRNQIHPKTLLSNGPGMRRLRALPLSDQKHYLESPVSLLTADGDTLQVAVRDLTVQQAKQVFSKDGVRPLSAQKAYLESRKTTKFAPVTPYAIRGHKILFRADCEMTIKELAQLLAQIS